MRPTIRSMTKKDKPAIMQILQVTPEFKPAEVVIAEEVIDSYLQNPIGSGYHVLVVEIDASVTGYICFGPTPLTEGTWDIYWIAVDPGKQRHGTGTILLKSAEKAIYETQGRLIIIETSSTPEYAKTRSFYNAHDYQPACRITDFYSPGDDKLIFLKRLR